MVEDEVDIVDEEVVEDEADTKVEASEVDIAIVADVETDEVESTGG